MHNDVLTLTAGAAETTVDETKAMEMARLILLNCMFE